VKNLLTLDVLPLGKYATETCARDIGCTTLVHGDMWTNNMLIELGPDGSVSDQILAIIDWQTFFEGLLLKNREIHWAMCVMDL
jgi:hypothetical protein